jgi:hypothetical protein
MGYDFSPTFLKISMLQQISNNHKSPDVFLIDVKVKGSNLCIHLLGPITLPQQKPEPPAYM